MLTLSISTLCLIISQPVYTTSGSSSFRANLSSEFLHDLFDLWIILILGDICWILLNILEGSCHLWLLHM